MVIPQSVINQAGLFVGEVRGEAGLHGDHAIYSSTDIQVESIGAIAFCFRQDGQDFTGLDFLLYPESPLSSQSC